MDWNTLLSSIMPALLGGGLVAFFTLPEQKMSKKLDNAERIIAKYEEIILKYEKRIEELEAQVKELKSKLQTMEEERHTSRRIKAKMED